MSSRKGNGSKKPSAVRYSPSVCSLSFTYSSPINGGAFWYSTNTAYSAVPLRGAIVSMGLRGVQGGLRGEIEIFPGPPAKKVIKMLICYLFVSTPQSIAKPSPGWNKVALLTAVRNSPCSCPFSVSLHPPLAALNSEPRPGSLFIANQKLSPRAGKVARSAERGAAKNSRMPRVIPPQLRLRSAAPPQAVAPFGCGTNSNTKPALKGEVAASATSRRRGCSEASVVYVNPSVNPPYGVLPAPRKWEPFGAV